MTKQEEIREGIEHVITVNHPYIARKITDEVIEYLHSQGAVIKKSLLWEYEEIARIVVEPLIEG